MLSIAKVGGGVAIPRLRLAGDGMGQQVGVGACWQVGDRLAMARHGEHVAAVEYDVAGMWMTTESTWPGSESAGTSGNWGSVASTPDSRERPLWHGR